MHSLDHLRHQSPMKTALHSLATLLVVAFCCVSSPATAADDESADYLDELVERADAQRLADDPQWHALMHYRSRIFGGVESDIDSPAFFLADDGKTDPGAELEATLAALLSSSDADGETHGSPDDHPQCRFPARYNWLDNRLDFDDDRLEPRTCDEFTAWSDRVGARSATLIFAAPYLTNPASMFGHTLLRFDRDGDDDISPLDSYVLNVSADPWTYNPILYIAMGLTGGFDGVFNTLSFDDKVAKYTDRERREMWEYTLDLDDRQLDRMLRHLWELRPANVDYRYFDENCSYFLMSILEVADPSLDLLDAFRFRVLPGEMVRTVLDADGLASTRQFRASSRQVMQSKRRRLESDETDLAHRLGADESRPALDELDELDEKRRAYVLDAALALWRYRNPPDEETGDVDGDWGETLDEHRREIPLATPAVEPTHSTAPEGGHGPARLTLAGGAGHHQGGIVELGFRAALHDLAASDAGHPPLEQLEAFNLRIRAGGLDTELQRPRILLQRLDILDIASYRPIGPWSRNWSWNIKTGFERTYRSGCGASGCLIYDAAAGFGATAEAGPLAGYLLMDGQLAAGPTFDYNLRLAAGPRIGSLLRLGNLARLHLEGSYRYPAWGEGLPHPFAVATDGTGPPWTARATMSISPTQNTEIRAVGIAERSRAEANLELHLYF